MAEEKIIKIALLGDDSAKARGTELLSSAKTSPWYQKSRGLLINVILLATLSIALFTGLVLMGLIATPFVALPIVTAVIAGISAVKIVIDNKPPSVDESTLEDGSNRKFERLEGQDSQQEPEKKIVFAKGSVAAQKFIDKQIEDFKSFIARSGLISEEFVVAVFFPNNKPVLQCSLGAFNPSDSQLENLEELKKKLSNEPKFLWKEEIQGFEISVADFEKICSKQNQSPQLPSLGE